MLPEILASWAYTPYRVALEDKKDHELGALNLPLTVFNPEEEGAIVHFSTLRDGQAFNWLWLFDDSTQANKLRLLPTLPQFQADPDIGIIEGSIPARGMNPYLPREIELLTFPPQWYVNFIEQQTLTSANDQIQQIWLGFNYREYIRTRSLAQSATAIFQVDEFVRQCKK